MWFSEGLSKQTKRMSLKSHCFCKEVCSRPCTMMVAETNRNLSSDFSKIRINFCHGEGDPACILCPAHSKNHDFTVACVRRRGGAIRG